MNNKIIKLITLYISVSLILGILILLLINSGFFDISEIKTFCVMGFIIELSITGLFSVLIFEEIN